MINYAIPICVAVIMILLSYGLIKYPEFKAQKNIKSLKPVNKKQWLILVGIVISISILTLCLILLYQSDWLTCVKHIIFGSFLWVFAHIDAEKHIIPNKLLLILIVIRAIILGLEFFFQSELFKEEIISDAIACVGMIVILALMRLIVKNGIGFGDIKLFAVIGLFFGIKNTLTITFCSFVISFAVSIFFLATKRKSKKDQIAFAPFILSGFLMSTILFGA